MAPRDEIIAYADEYLDVGSYPDYGPMGLQVVGAPEVARIACGVSASRELFERAAASGAQLLLVHHGLLWDRDSRVVDHTMRSRLEALFAADLNLAAYHLALDAHPEVGNNVRLAHELGVLPEAPFAGVGLGGPLEAPCSLDELVGRIHECLGRAPLAFASGPAEIRRAAICSGGGARYLADAAAAGYDCYVTGEPAEPSLAIAKEAGIHFVAAGHYATETLGVQALAAKLAGHFGLEWEFIDLPNPV